MSIVESNKQEITPAERQRIDEFSRELALALQRIRAAAEDQPEIRLPDDIQAKSIQITGDHSQDEKIAN